MTFYTLGRWVNDLLRKNVYHHQMRLVEFFHFHPGFIPLSPIVWEIFMKNLKFWQKSRTLPTLGPYRAQTGVVPDKSPGPFL